MELEEQPTDSGNLASPDSLDGAVDPADLAVFYESWDYDFVSACLPPMGYGGMFILRENADAPAWSFVEEHSPFWDSLHQNLFSQYRGERITDPIRLAKLPPVPPVPPYSSVPRRSRESYYLPDEPILAEAFPLFLAELRRRSATQATLCITLQEDDYETRHGDGKFLYLHDSVLHPQNGPEFVDTEKEEAQSRSVYLYYTRYLTVQLTAGGGASADSNDGVSPDTFDFPTFKLGLFEHYRPANALRLCEENLAKINIREAEATPT